MGRFLPILLHKFESFLEKTLLGRHMPKQIWRQREAKRKLIERSNKLYKTTCRKVPKTTTNHPQSEKLVLRARYGSNTKSDHEIAHDSVGTCDS